VGYADLTAKALPAGHPAEGHVEKIKSACTRAAELVRKILTFSAARFCTWSLSSSARVLSEFSTLLTRVLGEDIELSLTVADEAMIVEADRTQLEQILLNLCTNARQAMPHGGKLTLDLAPTGVDEQAPGRHIHLRVGDTGHGIDDATMSRLWEPFFHDEKRRARASGSRWSTAWSGSTAGRSAPRAGSAKGARSTCSCRSTTGRRRRARPYRRPAGPRRRDVLVAEDETSSAT